MPYQVQPASLQDAEAIGACVDKAFANSAFHQLMFPKEKAHLTPREHFREWKTRRQRQRMDIPNAMYFKTIEAKRPNVIVGYAGWFKPGHFSMKATTVSEEQQQQQPPADSVLHDVADAPPIGGAKADERPACLNGEALDEFSRKTGKQRDKIWSANSDFWYLEALDVDPVHQHKGIAGRLMQCGLEHADRDGLPIYLEATPDGSSMYRRYGFEPCGEFQLANGQYSVVLMIRWPGGVR
ncbi:hypothetical protein B0A55_00361 [Friedmanniomyces simplex]|uniref:N-acetyltransferase domain-containing protein n=1 Tax=Friedmanniomyces simplex TaxID=329884 RepID=A0A4V5NKB3_9PEZI|nr:hypothetical protein B0A55_00361 [Friedmanniomyces simplex]